MKEINTDAMVDLYNKLIVKADAFLEIGAYTQNFSGGITPVSQLIKDAQTLQDQINKERQREGI